MSRRLAIKTRTLTDSEKDFKSVPGIVKLLESAAWVDTEENDRRTSVYFSHVAPGPDDIAVPWFKREVDFTPIGIFMPDGSGGHIQIAGYLPGEIRWFGPYSTDDDLPNGWTLADGAGGASVDLSGDFIGAAPDYDLVAIQFIGYT